MNTDKYREQLLNLIQENKKITNRNEATTRLHLIDKLLQDCLGWKSIDISAEENYDKTYADYVLSVDGRRFAILEAKREGIYFELPLDHDDIEYSIEYLCKDNKQIKEALKQVIQYCNERGTEVGIVSNGWQIIALIATRSDGISPLEGKAIIFDSIEKMETNFIDFYNLLSKEGIQKKRLLHRLIDSASDTLPFKLSEQIVGYPGKQTRNELQTELKILAELVIEDISTNKEIQTNFIRECYIPTGTLTNYALLSKKILMSRYEMLFDEEQKQTAKSISSKNETFGREIIAESISKRPILLIGDVGVGKTMFIKNFIFIAAGEVTRNAITLYIDLGQQANISADIREAILEIIDDQLLKEHKIDIKERNFVRGTYREEIARFKQSYFSDLKKIDDKELDKREINFIDSLVRNKEKHIKTSLEHISRKEKKQILLFLDNADQREESTQQTVFLMAQEFASSWPLAVFVSIRPETYYSSKKRGALKAYHTKSFTILPPDIYDVIKKRLEFALKITKGEMPLNYPAGLKLETKNLENYINILLYSFDRDKQLIEFIVNICSGDLRFALDLINIFLGSGHVNVSKILKIYEQQGFYQVPIHEFLRAIIFGDNLYYDPNTSPVQNLIDIKSSSKNEHFLLLILLDFIYRSKKTPGTEGYISSSEIFSYLQNCGYREKQVSDAVLLAIKYGLIQGKIKETNIISIPETLCITTSGAYHFLKLIKLFIYLDAIIVDTPILDDQLRASLQSSIINHDIFNRLENCRKIISYLDSCWNEINENKIAFRWKEYSSVILEDIRSIEERARRKHDI